jgi:molybdopterin/thiamine biosynthesis adenylyltransferase
VDCLDDIPSRLALGEAARAAGIALVHGAVAGLYGQVVVIRPDGPGLEVVYPSGSSAQGVEAELGTPNSAPMLVAALQVQEAIKLLAGVGEVLTGLLRVDGYTGAFQVEPLAAETPHA